MIYIVLIGYRLSKAFKGVLKVSEGDVNRQVLHQHLIIDQ